jgi:hypothetical protein
MEWLVDPWLTWLLAATTLQAVVGGIIWRISED